MSLSKGSRVNLSDLKGQVVKKIGLERSKEYFCYLTMFLSLKLSKVEYEKLCRRLMGRENLLLHNQLMRSILFNALHGRGPPPVHKNRPMMSAALVKNSLVHMENGRKQRFMELSNQHLDSSVWSNGILPSSPRKMRSGIRDRKLKDQTSPLRPNGKVACFEEMGDKLIKENGILMPCDYGRPLQCLPTVTERSEENTGDSYLKPSNESGLYVLKDGADVEKADINRDSKSPLLALLGIPNCFSSVDWGRESLPIDGLVGVLSCSECGQLPDSETLRQYMNHIAADQGLSGISEESAEILNCALDAYLKRLIRSCIQMVGSRSHNHLHIDHLLKLQMKKNIRNGVVPSQNHLHLGSNGPNIGGTRQQISSSGISLHDFKVAMELNPNQLGEDWPFLLEKISLLPFKR